MIINVYYLFFVYPIFYSLKMFFTQPFSPRCPPPPPLPTINNDRSPITSEDGSNEKRTGVKIALKAIRVLNLFTKYSKIWAMFSLLNFWKGVDVFLAFVSSIVSFERTLKFSWKAWYRFFISCLVLEIFWPESNAWAVPPSWIIEDMHICHRSSLSW